MKKLLIVLSVAAILFTGCAPGAAEPAAESITPEPTRFAVSTEPPARPPQEERLEFTDDGKAIFYVGAFSSGNPGLEDAFGWLKTAVLGHNALSKEYEARIIDYGNVTVPESMYRLNTEIISGMMPDILMTLNMPVERYAEMGLLYDMSGWFDPSEFFKGPFDAMHSADGKLYEFSPAITYTTFYGLSENIGTDSIMSFDDLYAAWERFNVNGDKAFLMGFTNEQICLMLASVAEVQFSDRVAATCSFDSPEFIKLLEFCKNLPQTPVTTKIEIDNTYGNQYNYYTTRSFERIPVLRHPVSVKENESMLGILTTAPSKKHGTLPSYHSFFRGILSGDVTFIGIPGSDSASFNMEFPVVVSAGSKQLDGVKGFVDRLLSLTFMSFGPGDIRMVPIKSSVFVTQVLDNKELRIIGGELSYWQLDENFKPYTRAVFQEILDLIDDAHLPIHAPASQFDADMTFSVHPILREEIQAFFGGAQDSKRTAELIQMRYSIMLAEQG